MLGGELRCPYCKLVIAADLVGAVTILCRGCKRYLRIEGDGHNPPRFTPLAETTHPVSQRRESVPVAR